MRSNKRSRVYYITIISLCVVAFVIGIILFLNIEDLADYDFKETYNNFIKGVNQYYPKMQVYYLLINSTALILSFLPLGGLLLNVMTLYSFFSFGFISSMILSFSSNSLIFITVYFLIYVLFPGVLLTVESFYMYKVSIYTIKRLIRTKTGLNVSISITIKQLFLLAIIYIIYEVIIIIFGGKILHLIAIF